MTFNYKEYFKKIKPKGVKAIYDRFLFAFCSVHTTWERNVIGYNKLKGVYQTDEKVLKAKILEAGLGLTNHRTEYIKEFTEKFKTNPKFYTKRRNESWQKYADRLQKDIKGLGFAKTRFVIELIYPSSAKVCCVDTHIAQWAKQNPNKLNKRLYTAIEKGWFNHSKKHKLHPIEARWKWWDNKQGYDNPRYWSKCLE